MHRRFQALFGARSRHGLAGHFRRGQQQALASLRNVREESMLDGIVLRTLRRVVRHANFQAKAIRQGFQMVFENVASGGVAAAAVAQEQQPASVGIREAPIGFPPVTQTVAGEPTGVVAEAQIQMPEVALGIVEPVRVEHPESGTGKIVVERLLGFLRVEPPFAKQKAQKLLGFGVLLTMGSGD